MIELVRFVKRCAFDSQCFAKMCEEYINIPFTISQYATTTSRPLPHCSATTHTSEETDYNKHVMYPQTHTQRPPRLNI